MKTKPLHCEQARRPKGGTAGFTILETVIGIFVFTVGILAVANMQSHSLFANANARNISEAAAIASSMISDLRAVGYNDPALTGDNQTGANHDRNGYDPYTVGYNVRRLADLDDEAAVITMNVTWQDRGRDHSETFHYFKIDEYDD